MKFSVNHTNWFIMLYIFTIDVFSPTMFVEIFFLNRIDIYVRVVKIFINEDV